MRTAFVTGATGLLGANLVHQLTAAGWRVRALARSQDKADIQLAGIDVDIVVGDMERVSDFAHELRDVDTLFHTAAYFRDSYKGGSHWDKLFRVNVTGTEQLLDAAYAAGIRQMVHVSSTATVLPKDGQLGREDDRRTEAEADDDYYRSKVLADLAVEDFLRSHTDFRASFVLPGFMQGPRDMGPTSAGQMLLDFVHRRIPGVIDTNMSFVDARDVAHGVIQAAESGQSGRRYLIAGKTLHMAEALQLMQAATGVPAPTFRMPRLMLYLYAAFSELWARLSGRPVLLSWAGVTSIVDESSRARFDSSRAVSELGVTFRPLEESFSDSIAWYRAQGRVEASLQL